MALHQEIEFENDICNHLAANGWLYAEGDTKGYDTPRALFPADVVACAYQRNRHRRTPVGVQRRHHA